MSNDFTITLTDAELKGLEYVAVDPNAWIQNAIHERCRLAMEELVADDINTRLTTGQAISGTKEEMVLSSTLPNAQTRHNTTMQTMLAGTPSANT